MPAHASPTIPVTALRVGLYIHLDLGWMAHPFPFGSFKITSQQQIDTIQGLGLSEVRWDPDKSDPAPEDVPQPSSEQTEAAPELSPELERQRQLQVELTRLRQQLHQCERRFAEGVRAYKSMADTVRQQPEAAGKVCAQLVSDMVQQILGDKESAIRLLPEYQRDRASLHAMNVTVLCLLLGKAMGLPQESLEALGQAAMLHDLGKSELPDRVRHRDDTFTQAHLKLYQTHVAHSVSLAKQMGFPPLTLLTVSQHHEFNDGNGFPTGGRGEKLVPTSRILALINRYDGLCNPFNPIKALTPHEALSHIFSAEKGRFDGSTLASFIRMMGVYPPGSLVQLTDGRYGLVAAVNSSRPLKPRVLVYDAGTVRDDAVLLDLQAQPQLGIQRSLKADHLPRQALEFLAPSQRSCYYFERAINVVHQSELS